MMGSFFRISLMFLATLAVLAVCFGGGKDINAFGFVAGLLLFFWGIPILIFVALLHSLERWLGTYARLLIAMIGLIPLGLSITFGASLGDPDTTRAIVAGLAWSCAWIVTSVLFPKPEAPPIEGSPATCSPSTSRPNP
jgi:hypothetical protein